jgi:uncharacterized protein YabE (DUF348 family)
VTLSLNQQFLGTFLTKATTVSEFLRSQNIILNERDRVWPAGDTPLSSGMTVILDQARSVTIEVDGKRDIVQTTADTVLAILEERKITLDEDDLIEPAREVVVGRGGVIEVIRVEIREEHKDTSINFATKTNEDPELSWRTKKVTQQGEKGVKRTTYRVSYHDGKEVKRKVMKTEVIKEPVTEVVTQGTYVKLGKKHTGAASWYAWTGTMAAANPWLPKGSYVKVTNVDNGKSVIVVINDRGPFVPGRIIDLDKVAFAQIASVGAGVINVKMEEIVN